MNPSLITDYDANRGIGKYTIENVMLNGKPFNEDKGLIRKMIVN